MKPRVYIDTSVVGGYYDEEFETDTRLFFERVEKAEIDVYVSEVTETELVFAPAAVREVLKKVPGGCFHFLELSDETRELADQYLQDSVLPKSSYNDALHIALASVHRLDVLISWNFKHIVNYNRIRMVNAVNLRLGYPLIDIRSPKEFINYGSGERENL